MNRIPMPLLLLVLAEAAILYASVYAAALVVFGGDLARCEEAVGPLFPRAFSASLVVLLSLLAVGLYQFHQRINYREVFARVLVGLMLGSVVLAAISYVLPSIALSPRFWATAFLLAAILILLVRLYFVSFVDENIFRRKTLVFGAGERADSISMLRRRADRRGFKIVGSIAAQGDKNPDAGSLTLTGSQTLSALADELGAEEIVIAVDDRRGNLPIRELLDCRLGGVEVIELIEFLERETGKIRIDLVSPGWLIFSEGFRKSRFRMAVKRVTDIAVSALAFCVFWPVMVLVALAIKLEDGFSTPVLYRQLRVGHNGNPFNVLKFRSMVVNAEADGKAVWASENDTRVTRVGRLIRTLRFDELPQILNVLRGQMSIVGPRPERPQFVEQLSESIPYYAERHTVKPGVTGWAQLRYSYGASEEDAAEKLQYDLYYVKNHSLLLDLVIILQTLEVILWGKGAR
jgi:sugar transferase (PEP-CTERM system associated)